MLLVTFQSNILHNLATSYKYFTYEYACRTFFSLQQTDIYKEYTESNILLLHITCKKSNLAILHITFKCNILCNKVTK